MKVLVADDSILLRERLKDLLQEIKQVEIVGEAETVIETKEKVEALHPEVVIQDIRMPGGTGLEALKYIKEKYPDTYVIVLTNYDQEQYRNTSEEYGADYFICKITEFEKTADAIKEIMKKSNK